MNKKLFSWKALAGLALLVAMGLTSCTSEPVDNEDPAKKPSTDPTATIVVDGDVVSVGALKPSDITEALKKLTAASTRSAEKEYTVLVSTASMKVTDADKTITIPAGLDDCTWNFIFDGAYAEDKAILIIKDNNLDFVNFSFPEAEYKGFDFEMPYSTVTIEGDAVIGELKVNMDEDDVRGYNKSQTIGDRYLNLADDTYVKGLDYRHGGILVAEDAKIVAYIAGNNPTAGNTFTPRKWNSSTLAWDNQDDKTYNVEYVYIDEDKVYKAGVAAAIDEDGNPYGFEELIVRKNETPYIDGVGNVYKDYGFVNLARIDDSRNRQSIEQVTVEDGGRLLLDANDLAENVTRWADYNGAKFIGYDVTWGGAGANEHAVWSQNVRIKRLVGNGKGIVSYTTTAINNTVDQFKGAESVSNLVIASSVLPSRELAESDWANVWNNAASIAAPVSGCTFSKYANVAFTIESDEVATSKFPSANFVHFDVNCTDDRTTYDFFYNACEFKKDVELGVNQFTTGAALLDEDGDPIVYQVWDYAKVNAAGTDFVYSKTTPVFSTKDNTSAAPFANAKQDADGNAVLTEDVASWSYVYESGKQVEISDITNWDYIPNFDFTNTTEDKIFFKDGVYAIFKEFTNPGTATEKWVGYKINVTKAYEWVYNQKIDYKEIPMLARKKGLCTYRVIYAQADNTEIEDMKITINLTGSKIDGKTITDKTSVNVNTPRYFNDFNWWYGPATGEGGMVSSTDAKMKYRFNINDKIYRYAYDTSSAHWFFIPVAQ